MLVMGVLQMGRWRRSVELGYLCRYVKFTAYKGTYFCAEIPQSALLPGLHEKLLHEHNGRGGGARLYCFKTYLHNKWLLSWRSICHKLGGAKCSLPGGRQFFLLPAIPKKVQTWDILQVSSDERRNDISVTRGVISHRRVV